jgi:hypothetical protein
MFSPKMRRSRRSCCEKGQPQKDIRKGGELPSRGFHNIHICLFLQGFCLRLAGSQKRAKLKDMCLQLKECA